MNEASRRKVWSEPRVIRRDLSSLITRTLTLVHGTPPARPNLKFGRKLDNQVIDKSVSNNNYFVEVSLYFRSLLTPRERCVPTTPSRPSPWPWLAATAADIAAVAMTTLVTTSIAIRFVILSADSSMPRSCFLRHHSKSRQSASSGFRKRMSLTIEQAISQWLASRKLLDYVHVVIMHPTFGSL